MRWLILSLSLAAPIAGACYSTKLPPEPPEPPAVSPEIAATQWWLQGDKACPWVEDTGDAPSPTGSAAPGARGRRGVLRGAPPPAGQDVWCDLDGVAHGPAATFHPDGRLASTGRFDNGGRAGPWASWHSNGQMASYGQYEADQPTGTWMYWYPSGAPQERGVMTAGRRTGMWLTWDANDTSNSGPSRFVVHGGSGGVTMHGVYRDGKPRRSLPVCIQGFSYPECRTVLITDLTLRNTPDDRATSSESGDSPWSATFELGAIVNLDEHQGVGLSAGWYFGDEYAGGVLRGRYRYWLNRWASAEVGYGLLLPRPELDQPGDTGHSFFAVMDLANWLAAGVELDRYRASGRSETSIHFNLRFGLPTLLSTLYVLSHIKS